MKVERIAVTLGSSFAMNNNLKSANRKEKISTDFLPQTSVSKEYQVLHVCGGDHGLVAETGEFRSLRTQDDVAIES